MSAGILETGFAVMMGLRNVLAIWFKGNGVNSVGFQGMLGFTDVHVRGFREVEGLQRCAYNEISGSAGF
jgi:hypothetical protein